MARKMKDSGIEWIGEIPEGWEVVPVKRLCTMQAGKNLTSEQIAPEGTYPVYGGNGIRGFFSDYNCDGQFLTVGRQGALCGNVHKINGKVWATEHAVITTPSSYTILDFLYYLLIGMDLNQYVSSTAAQPGLAVGTLLNLKTCYPCSKLEQTQISNYLNAKCAEIDIMLSKTRSSIEDYKKLKQAVITQAVTKGVRGEREMKDSGVEWIGEIPKEFNPVQLKFFCKLITDGTHFSPTTVENGWPYITAGDVHGIGLDYNSAKRISEEDFQLLVAQGCQPLKGDVLLVKDGATTGRVGFVDSDTPCVILSSVAMLRPADNADGHYLMYLLASDFLQKQILVSMAGSAMPRTTLTKLTKYIGLLPPLHEQKEIANYLDAKCAEIDKLIAKKEQLVKELESYKKSLIYEVVTGKREV